MNENNTSSMSPTDCIHQIAQRLDLSGVVDEFLQDRRFASWSGSDSKLKHHYGEGGLALHTWEVIQLGFSTAKTLNLSIDEREWFLAALFHDSGKMFDYEPITAGDFSEWKASDHKRLIHHISRSAVIWTKLCVRHQDKLDRYSDSVLHAILAHHGQREWGSPVAPKTRIAWLLHLCDNLSARMNDCDKLDYLKHREPHQ